MRIEVDLIVWLALLGGIILGGLILTMGITQSGWPLSSRIPITASAETPVANQPILAAIAQRPAATPGTDPGKPAAAPTPSATPRPGTAEKNLTYCSPDGVDIKMDVYYPDAMRGPVPAIVYLHGGGWTGGDKREAAQIWEALKRLPGSFVLVSLNYRLAPAYPFPAQIEDVKCAIRHLRANAGRYGVDPERIGVMGASAGGHLAALLGLTSNGEHWEVGENLDQSSAVKAVVTLAGPSDFTPAAHAGFAAAGTWVARNVFGITDPKDARLAEFSPVTYATKAAPPFLLIHGDRDTLVPPEQSQVLHQALKDAGASSELVLVKGAGHSVQTANSLDVALKIYGFFTKHLR